MTPSEALDQVRNIASDLFQVPVAGITADASPVSIETWDSVQHLNLVLELEQRFGVRFEPEEMDGMKSIGEIATLVLSKSSAL